MRSNRRLVLTDRIIPFLAAGVGLVALAGAVLVQVNADARTRYIAGEMAGLRASIDQLAAETKALAAPSNDGTIEAMLALQDRMNRLEEEWAERPAETASAPIATGSASNIFSTTTGGAPAAVDRAGRPPTASPWAPASWPRPATKWRSARPR